MCSLVSIGIPGEKATVASVHYPRAAVNHFSSPQAELQRKDEQIENQTTVIRQMPVGLYTCEIAYY